MKGRQRKLVNRVKIRTTWPQNEINTTEPISEEEEETGFNAWLQSGTGVECMKIFVILNSIIVFTTFYWSHFPNVVNDFLAFFD